jgi:hypothetical protein
VLVCSRTKRGRHSISGDLRRSYGVESWSWGGVQYRPIGQTRHTYAVIMLQRERRSHGFSARWGPTTLQMLIRHYWRYMQAHDLRADEMGEDYDRRGFAEDSNLDWI